MSAWVICSIEEGMLPGEYAVQMDTVDGRISLFAPEHKVRADENLMSVQRLHDDNGSGILVRLPSPPFEISSQNVRVRHDSLVNK